MDEKLLSQEEIDALLRGRGAVGDNQLDSVEIDALGEIGNISMGTAATTLSLLLGQEVKITTPRVEVTTKKKLRREYPYPYVLLEVLFVQGVQGSNLLVVKEDDALLMSELMMGGEGPPAAVTKLDEMRLSAVGEAMNQMMGSAATAVSSVFQKPVSISPPKVHYINLAESELDLVGDSEYLVKISFEMAIGDLADTEIMQILPLNFAREMVSTLMGSLGGTQAEAHAERPAAESVAKVEALVAAAPSEGSMPNSSTSHPSTEGCGVGKTVQPVQFAPLVEEQRRGNSGTLDMILDIPLEVTVELGRTKRLIKDVLELAVGSVIELDKLAGEPVDVLVNGKIIARGEVVVIDENFGVRITDILTPLERVRQLQ